MKADSLSEIARLTKELAQVQKHAAELSDMLAARYAEESARAYKVDKLTKEHVMFVEQVASLVGSPKAYIDTQLPSAVPVAADATSTLALPEAGAFLHHDGPACSAIVLPSRCNRQGCPRASSACTVLEGAAGYPVGYPSGYCCLRLGPVCAQPLTPTPCSTRRALRRGYSALAKMTWCDGAVPALCACRPPDAA